MMREEKIKTKNANVCTGHMFSNSDLRKILIPVAVEQVLASMMGTADTMMVSNVGSAAISAASLVDSLNILVIQAFAALSAGGAIICAHYIGGKNKKDANHSAGQVMFIVTLLSTILMAVCLIFNEGLLKLIFGQVEEDVMRAAKTYFFYTALSFPFIGIYDAGASVFRAQGNTRTPMIISVTSNILNVGGNAMLIWGFNMGIAGAAIATLFSRIYCAVVILVLLRKPSNEIVFRNYLKIRPDKRMLKKILKIGVPSGIENGMFQFGKLAIQSTVSTLGTAAIAAQAMTNILEGLNGIAAMGIGIGLMTIVGQCMGAGRKDEAKYYIKKVTLFAEIVVIVSCLLVFVVVKPVTVLGGMEKTSASLCLFMMGWITLIKPIVWTLAFIPAYGMRGAGDVKFSMIVSALTMWLCRVFLCIVLIRKFNFGPMAVWIGMFSDWTIRTVLFTIRFFSGKWAKING